MAINLITEYQKKIAERFTLGSLTDEAAGHDYDFAGAKTIEVLSVDTVETVDYTRSGTARYGDVTELGDTKQTLTLAVDKGFTFSIDAGNASEQYNVKQANRCLKREWDEVCTPEIDAYRLSAWANGKGLSSGKSVLSASGETLTKENIVESIFTGSARMSDKKVPRKNRYLFIPELTFVRFQLADVVLGGGQLNKEAVEKGFRGTIDGMKVITVPSSLWPSLTGGSATLNFIIKYKGATVDPMKLKNLRVQKNPMGIDGDVVEGRYIYDSFVKDASCDGIFISTT
ncbi:MAG: hypothetical protein SPI09_00390 [Candidatus Limivicinus sp.]|nr:hypothetical protein [Clostridiales bacterium]MDY6131809.1 hypothetical protein [Candidatus Limivicinus sp.]